MSKRSDRIYRRQRKKRFAEAKRQERAENIKTKNPSKDEDIDLEKVDSCIVHQAVEDFNSFYDNEDTFYFVIPDVGWFSLIQGASIYVNDSKYAEELEQCYMFVDTLRSIWVRPTMRGRGVQNRILEAVKGYADSCSTAIMSFPDPYKIDNENKHWNVEEGMINFEKSYSRPDNYEEELDKQIGRFEKAGFQNIDWSAHAQVTDVKQHYVYIGEGIEEEQRTIIESLLVA
jgi:GNAT superfamily N-acetyltransferase